MVSALKSLKTNEKTTIDFETQVSFRTQAPPNVSPSKRAFEKYQPRGLFLEFYGMIRARADITNTDRTMMKISTAKIIAFSPMIPLITIKG